MCVCVRLLIPLLHLFEAMGGHCGQVALHVYHWRQSVCSSIAILCTYTRNQLRLPLVSDVCSNHKNAFRIRVEHVFTW